jgi:hypothetical protein
VDVFPLLIFCSRKNPVELLVIPNNEGAASGYMYWDDGDSLSKIILLFRKLHFCMAK